MMPDAVDRPFNPPKILDASGRPARSAVLSACPSCGHGSEKRVKSAAFGTPHPVCSVCGYEWFDEVWRD